MPLNDKSEPNDTDETSNKDSSSKSSTDELDNNKVDNIKVEDEKSSVEEGEVDKSSDDNIPKKEENFFERFFRIIRNEISDLSYVEIVTAVGDPKTDLRPDAEDVIIGLKEKKLDILARTRIELDGDIMVLLPGARKGVNDEPIIYQNIMQIHDKNVAVAVQNWQVFMNNIFSALRMLMNVTGMDENEIKTKFNQPVSVTTPTTTTTTDKTNTK
jgi:hypothetical protein